MRKHLHVVALGVPVLLFQGVLTHAEVGRPENIAVRRQPPVQPPIYSGPYREGVPLPEQTEADGVRVGELKIRQEHATLMRQAGYLPFRREMDDAELAILLNPGAPQPSESGWVGRLAAWFREPAARSYRDYLRERLTNYPLSLFGGGRGFNQPSVVTRAEDSYRDWFDAEGRLLEKDFAWISPPYMEMVRWGHAYRTSGDGKWARAIVAVHNRFYHGCRPPAGKIGQGASKVFSMWRPLTCGAGTPSLIEAYALIRDYPGLTEEDARCFLKGMAERGQFLRYTTQPVGPWPKFNPFGYGNWLLYQLQGLLAIAATFPELAGAPEWREHAWKGIETHAAWTVFPDGGFAEDSYAYAAQVAGQLQWCYQMALRYQIPFSVSFVQDVKRLHTLFLKTATTANLRLPFGDTARGDGVTPQFARWAALAFLDGRFKYWAAPCREDELREAMTLLHPGNPGQALEQYQQLAPVPPDTVSDLLPETGWVVMRSGWEPDATVVALTYRTSERVYHSGYETLGINIWKGKTPLMTRLQGRSGYEGGYPRGFRRTPATANLVLAENAGFTRESGSLRNWYTSAALDYLDADHLGVERCRVKRRILFLKPSWVLILDDVEGNASPVWQANTDTVRPVVEGNTAILANGKATLHFLNAQPDVEAYPLPGSTQTVYQLKARSGSSRFVTLLQIGPPSGQPPRLFHEPGMEGVEFAMGRVVWESQESKARFLQWRGNGDDWFAASDGNPNPVTPWRVAGSGIPPFRIQENAIVPEAVHAFEWIGANHLNTVETGARVYWRTDTAGTHSVRYREAGRPLWRLQLQPGFHHEAWLLLPDLKSNRPYELQAITELPDGTVLQSPILQRQTPNL